MSPDDTIATRASLLHRLKNCEDQESWQEFFDTYWRLIYSVATHAGLNDAEAQDVVQETVISVARHVGGFQYDPSICSFKTWMLRMTQWRILDRLRRRERETAGLGLRVHLSQVPAPLGSAASAPEDNQDQTATLDRLPDQAGVDLEALWEREWQRNTLAAALESIRTRIKPEQFQIFHLYAVRHLPVGQVARLVGVSVASVYLTKHRVTTLLKREVGNMEAAMQRRLVARTAETTAQADASQP